MIRHAEMLLAGVILATSLAFPADKKQDEAKALIDRAKQLSDIRADGSPAFELKVSIKTINQDSTTSEGTYTETWVSREKWRSETIIGPFHSVSVVNANKRWVSKDTLPAPSGLSDVGFRMDSPFFTPEYWKITKIEDKNGSSTSIRCLESDAYILGGASTVCIEKNSGLVAGRRNRAVFFGRSADRACIYSNYQKFGDKLFPWVTRCSENQKVVFESSVLVLTRETSPDPTLFAPLVNAKESVNCPVTTSPPIATFQPQPELPKRENLSHPVIVAVSVSVGVDGLPKDFEVVRSVDSAFDAAALKAVRDWRFKPAACGGRPIETTVRVEVEFRSF